MLTSQLPSLEFIKEYLAILKRLDEAFFLQGADCHKYMLNACLEESELESIEQASHISLPTAFREFLQKSGNGGAGPEYGVYTLQKAIHTVRNNDWLLSETNLLTLDNYCLFGDSSSQNQFSWMFNGCLPIADNHCGSIFLLILSGKKSEQIWEYNHNKGQLHKVCDHFRLWYEKWLSTCLVTGSVAEIKNHFMTYGEMETIAEDYIDIRMYFESNFSCFDDVWMLNLLLPLGDIHAYESMGWLYLCEDNMEKSLELFQKLYVSTNEKMKSAGAHGLWALYMLEGQVTKALQIGEVALAISKFCQNNERIYELQYALSLTYAVVGRKEQALKAAESLVEIFPIMDTSFEILAALHVKFGDKQLAKQSITRLINKNPIQRSQYNRKLWHIYKQIGAEDWSYWIAQLIGCKDEKKMLQRMQGKREELRRVLQQKYQQISNFCHEQIEKVSYMDELEDLISIAKNSDRLEDFEIQLLQYTYLW